MAKEILKIAAGAAKVDSPRCARIDWAATIPVSPPAGTEITCINTSHIGGPERRAASDTILVHYVNDKDPSTPPAVTAGPVDVFVVHVDLVDPKIIGVWSVEGRI